MSRFKIRGYTNSIAFDGSTSFLAKATPAGINTGTTSRSAMGWVYLNSDTVISTFVQFKVNSSQSPGFVLGSLAGTYYFALDTINAGNNKTLTEAVFKANFPLRKWLHVAFVSTTTTITLYVNGASITSVAWGTAINTGAYDNLFLGKSQSALQADLYFLNGNMKDVVIANAALSGSEVQAHYYSGTLPSSTIDSYAMEEGSGTTIADGTSSNTLTATGITWSTTNLPLAPRSTATNRFLTRQVDYSIFVNGVDGTAPNALSCANSASLNQTGSFSIECWFQPIGTQKSFLLLDNSTDGVTDSYSIIIGILGKLSFFSTIGGSAANIVSASSQLVKWNQWNFVCVSYTGSKVNLFLNGNQLSEQVTASGSVGTNSGVMRMGAYYTGGGSLTMLGYIYRPRIYSTSMFLVDHQNRYYRNITSTALAAAIAFDPAMTEGSGSTAADSSGNSNTVTLNSSASWSSVSPFKARTAVSGRSTA